LEDGVDRTAIFIDGAYLDKLLDHEFGRARIDYGAFAKQLAQGPEMLRTYYYHCPPYQNNPPTEDERRRTSSKNRFFTALSSLSRFQVRLGKLAFRGLNQQGAPIFVQKRVDIMLGVDMVQLAATRQITRAVLLAGDSDFVPALEIVKQHGVLVVLWHGPRGPMNNNTVHHELWDAADDRFVLTRALLTGVAR